jgi:tyramine---L-glutamate ligase
VLIFVSEFLTSGAWRESQIPASLLKEGRAMLLAIAADFASIPGCQAIFTWDERLGSRPDIPEAIAANIEARIVRNPAEEQSAFEVLCQRADAVLVIAPEFQHLLADRRRCVERIGTESLNCSVDAIRQCTDKLNLARQLESLGIPTIPTREVSDPQKIPCGELEYPLVIKPRDGAGSQDTYLIHDEKDWQSFLSVHGRTGGEANWILQPYVPGRTLSIAAIVGEAEWNGEPGLEVFPLAEQQLTTDGRFGYLGGRIPETISLQHLATTRVREVVAQIPGLSGYIGFDLLAPNLDPQELLIVEINPRLTTSYLGYRALADQNLAEYLLPSRRPEKPLRWKSQVVRFTADGAVSWNERLR